MKKKDNKLYRISGWSTQLRKDFAVKKNICIFMNRTLLECVEQMRLVINGKDKAKMNNFM